MVNRANPEIYPCSIGRDKDFYVIRHKVGNYCSALVTTKHIQSCKLFWLRYLVVQCSWETDLFHFDMVLTCSVHVSSYISLILLYLCSFSLNSTADWQYAANEFVKQLPDDVIVHCKLCHFVLSINKFIFLLSFFFTSVSYLYEYALCLFYLKHIVLWK